MGFISSSRVLNIVMTLFFTREENSENKLHSRHGPPLTFSSPHSCVYFPDCLLPFLPYKASFFCQDKPQYVSAHCCLEMFDRGAQWKHLPQQETSLPLSASWAYVLIFIFFSFRLRCSVIRGWGLHHQVPSSEEFIQPLPQWVLCVAGEMGLRS